MELTNQTGDAAPAPPWQRTGGVSAVDTGQFAETIAAMRPNRALTKAQIDAVLDALMQARATGADMLGLDPTAPPHVRMPVFAAIIRSAIVRNLIPDMTLTDDLTLQALYDATLGWGPVVQRLLDDPLITEVKINGTTALATGARGLVVIPNAYETVDEPRSRVTALTQLRDVTWDATHPSVTVPLTNKTRLHATRAPLLPTNDLLIVIRRGRTSPWGLPDLVARGVLSEEAASLLTSLIQARLSLIVSGAQDSGKTTFLECVLNTLPSHDHIVLVEDNTDEFCLRSPLITRLRVNESSGTMSDNRTSTFAVVVRETLRMTPSFLAPGEVRGQEAGAIAQIAEAGRPTGTTIHARTAAAALWRFARLAASDTPGNSFARQPAAALRVIAESFQLIVHMVFSQRLGRRIVQEVALLGGVDSHGDPIILPLITVQMDSADTGVVHWTCHAHIVDQALVWNDAKRAMPRMIAALMADATTGATSTGVSGVIAEEQVKSLLLRARELLPYPDQAAQAIEYLEQARDLAPDGREVWALAERLLAHNAVLQADTATRMARMIERLEHAIAARDLAAVRVALSVDSVPLIGQVALQGDGRWQAACDNGTRLLEIVEDLEAALAAASVVAKQQDYNQALRLLRGFAPHMLPDAYARRVLRARIDLLEAQQEKLGADGATTLEPQLQQARRQMVALETTGEASLEATAGGDARGEVVGSGSADTRLAVDAVLPEADISTIATHALFSTNPRGHAAEATDPPVSSGRAAASIDPVPLADTAIGAPDEAAMRTEAARYGDIPIRIRAAAEVGSFAAALRMNQTTTQERNRDFDDT